MTLFKAAGL